jgi:ABC-2 type transport system ATP-binding protein
VQRIGIAQALLADPQLLVLDEPTSGLDPASRRDVLELLSRLKSAGKTVFISSHILPEVEQIADRIIVIDRGRLVRAGRLSELLDPGHRVEILVGDLPADAEQAAIARGASVEHLPSGARLVFDAAHKREMTEMLWVAGCDIISMNPVTSSLQDLFLKLVAEYENAV